MPVRPVVRKLRERILSGVGWLIDSTRRRAIVLTSVLLSVGLIIVMLTPPAEYLPEGEEPKTFARMIAPPGYNLTEMSRIGEQVEDYLMPFVGDDPARFAPR